MRQVQCLTVKKRKTHNIFIRKSKFLLFYFIPDTELCSLFYKRIFEYWVRYLYMYILSLFGRIEFTSGKKFYLDFTLKLHRKKICMCWNQKTKLYYPVSSERKVYYSLDLNWVVIFLCFLNPITTEALFFLSRMSLWTMGLRKSSIKIIPMN